MSLYDELLKEINTEKENETEEVKEEVKEIKKIPDIKEDTIISNLNLPGINEDTFIDIDGKNYIK